MCDEIIVTFTGIAAVTAVTILPLKILDLASIWPRALTVVEQGKAFLPSRPQSGPRETILANVDFNFGLPNHDTFRSTGFFS